MAVPSAILAFEKEGEHLLKEGKIEEIIFSNRTYQIGIKEKGELFWPFLTFDKQNQVTDYFCNCQESEEKDACPHLAAAVSVIFRGTKEPMHLRYLRSFWYAFFSLMAQRIGFEKQKLKKEKIDHLYNFSAKNFTLRTKKKKIRKICTKKNEDISFAFSALSGEDQILYKEGRASFDILFEFSHWSDLAKLALFYQEDKKPYTISFTEEKDLPLKLFITFTDFEIDCHLAKEELIHIIPSLRSVKAPLHVSPMHPMIDYIRYENEAFHIKAHEEEMKEKEGVTIGEWLYVSKEGFYKKMQEPLFAQKVIPKKQMAKMLSEHTDTLKRYAQNFTVNDKPQTLHYDLFFDEKEQLHIKAYLFEKEDLFQKEALFIPPWCYIPQKGFFYLEDLLFDEKEQIITKEDVAEFVSRNTIFLHDYPGFETHFGALESDIHYEVSEEGDLSFYSTLDISEDGNVIDFGRWIYVKEQGFFHKKKRKELLFLQEDNFYHASNVSTFITTHAQELQLVPHFFSENSPYKDVGLDISLDEKKQIVVEPKREYNPEYDADRIISYEECVYIKGEGFYLLPAHLKLPDEYSQKVVIPPSKELFFIQYEMKRLERFLISVDDRVKKPDYLHLCLYDLTVDKAKRRPLIHADFYFSSNIGKIALFELWEAIAAKKKIFFSSAGALILKEDRYNWVRNLKKRSFHRIKKTLKLNIAQWLRLNVLEKKIELPVDPEKRKQIETLLQNFTSFDRLPPFDISLLHSRLRPYQEIGCQWLWYLYYHGLSGLLCDDMGLGKTHQAMALLAAVKKEDSKHKFLVICPTSVIYHWEELLQRFLPSMRVLVHHGVERSLTGFTKEYDLLLTSYGIMRTGREKIKDIHFEVAIFDEIQIAKNPKSQTNKQLKEVHASTYIGLTGTPIENYLIELKAIFDVVLPQYFPPLAQFKELFVIPIEKNQDPEKKKLLSSLIKPFILRRKKNEVLLDLPEKIEEVSYCDLTQEQQSLYHEISSSFKNQILPELAKEEVPYMHIFSLLMKLKQVCDHPSLIYKDINKYHQHESGKFALFEHLLSEARDSQQKVVIFSQYLDMIAILEKYLKKKRIGYAILTGETKKRKEAIKKFKEDPKCEIFLASLLAAGVGIDLSNASIVIHYDRWWNPAKENQATDRVHRIGQNRGVQVFKLVTKNTIEEDIHALIERKKGLIEETIGKDDMDQIKQLSKEELMEIIQRTFE